jgi:hypothetical protein
MTSNLLVQLVSVLFKQSIFICSVMELIFSINYVFEEKT